MSTDLPAWTNGGGLLLVGLLIALVLITALTTDPPLTWHDEEDL